MNPSWRCGVCSAPIPDYALDGALYDIEAGLLCDACADNAEPHTHEFIDGECTLCLAVQR